VVGKEGQAWNVKWLWVWQRKKSGPFLGEFEELRKGGTAKEMEPVG